MTNADLATSDDVERIKKMPKRRMTPARKAAIAKWQAAGARSRKSRVKRWSAKELAEPRKDAFAFIDKDPKYQIVRPELRRTMLIPSGKNMRLYHRTKPENVGSILKNGFGRNKRSKTHGSSWFTQGTKPPPGYGSALLSVTIPRKKVKHEDFTRPGQRFVYVKNTDLVGVKIRKLN